MDSLNRTLGPADVPRAHRAIFETRAVQTIDATAVFIVANATDTSDTWDKKQGWDRNNRIMILKKKLSNDHRWAKMTQPRKISVPWAVLSFCGVLWHFMALAWLRFFDQKWPIQSPGDSSLPPSTWIDHLQVQRAAEYSPPSAPPRKRSNLQANKARWSYSPTEGLTST